MSIKKRLSALLIAVVLISSITILPVSLFRTMKLMSVSAKSMHNILSMILCRPVVKDLMQEIIIINPVI